MADENKNKKLLTFSIAYSAAFSGLVILAFMVFIIYQSWTPRRSRRFILSAKKSVAELFDDLKEYSYKHSSPLRHLVRQLMYATKIKGRCIKLSYELQTRQRTAFPLMQFPPEIRQRIYG